MTDRKAFRISIAMGWIVALTALGSTAARAQIALSPQTPVSALRHEWNAAFNARDTARLGRLVLDSTLFVSPRGKLEGRDAVTAIFAQLFNRPSIILTFTPKGLLPAQPAITDSVVSEYGTWRESWNEPDGPVVLDGTYYDVWTRQPEGWRIAIHAFTRTGCSGSLSYCSRR